jgi:hypothetical protein
MAKLKQPLPKEGRGERPTSPRPDIRDIMKNEKVRNLQSIRSIMLRIMRGVRLIFRFNGKPVAQAIVARIERPGESSCETTGRFRMGWKVFWEPESFVDLREKVL